MKRMAQLQINETPAQIMERQRVGLKDLEVPQDVQPYGERRAANIEWINKMRARIGNPPLVNDEVEHPELAQQRQVATERYLAERREIQRQRKLARPERRGVSFGI